MKKTLTANVGGTVFHIEEDAYDRLRRYLESIRAQFAGSESAAEIMADIEARIAELFGQRIEGRQVVNLADVEHVIGVMGQPEDYVGEESGTEADSGKSANGERQGDAGAGARRRYRRLYRDTEDQWVGGVLSGVAHFFGIDPLVLRLVYIILLLVGVGWVIYIILWIVVPPAGTAAEKLEMRGEPVNVDNIKRMFEEGAERVKQGAERVFNAKVEFNVGSSGAGQRTEGAASGAGTAAERSDAGARGTVQRVFAFIGEAFRLGIAFLGKLFGASFLFAGTLLAVALAVLLASRFDLFSFGNDSGQNLGEWSRLLFLNNAQDDWAWIAATVFILVPVIGLLYGGISMLFHVKAPRWTGWVLTPLWIGSIIVLSVIGVRVAQDFRVQAEDAEDHVITAPANGVLHLEAISGRPGEMSWRTRYKHGHVSIDGDLFDATGDSLRWADADVDIRRSPDSLYHLVMVRNARGSDLDEARQRAAGVTGRWAQHDSVLQLGHVVQFPKRDRIRAQEVDFIVLVPVGGAVHIDGSVEHMLDDVKNVTDTWDWDMGGRTWTMTSQGLKELDEPAEKPKEGEEKEDAGNDSPVTPAPEADIADDKGTDAIAATVFRKQPVKKAPAPQRTHAAAARRSAEMPGLLNLLSRLLAH